jgi:hypothetical protein
MQRHADKDISPTGDAVNCGPEMCEMAMMIATVMIMRWEVIGEVCAGDNPTMYLWLRSVINL